MMTPAEHVSAIEAFSDADDPDGLLEYASNHLADVMPQLSLDQAIRLTALGEWAAMIVNMREFSEQTATAGSAG